VVHRRALLLLTALAASALAQGRTSPEARLAQEFAEAHRLANSDREALLAARPAREIAYPLVIDWLCWQGQPEVAEVLARLRAAKGPEGPALLRQVEIWRAGQGPGQAQVTALQRAEAALAAGKAVDALREVGGAGEPVAGTTFAARIAWTRARAFDRAGQTAEAVVELARCAEFARAAGWLAMERDAEQARLSRATAVEEKLAAADGYYEAAHKLEDVTHELAALKARAVLRCAVGLAMRERGQEKEGRALADAGRQDFRDAIDLAGRSGKPLEAALLWRDLAYVLQTHEKQPRQALDLYEKSIEGLRAIRQLDRLDEVLFNTTILLTQLARYDEALERLGEILRRGGPLKPAALAQRAYVLSRQGRVEEAARGYADALAATEPGPARVRLLVDRGALLVQRGDLRAAERSYRDALLMDPSAAAAWAGRARVRGMRGDEEGARADFAKALEKEKDPAARARWLVLQAAALRSWGLVPEALKSAQEALGILVDVELREYANAGAAYQIVADLLLLQRRFKEALDPLAKAGTLFFRLNDLDHMIDLYAQETLLLLMLKDDTAVERLKVLVARAPEAPEALQSEAKATEAIFEARAGRMENAMRLLDEAEALAVAAGDPLRQATALVNRALLDAPHALEHVKAAHALLDARRLDAPEEHPLIEGHRPDRSCAIALKAMLDLETDAPADALALIERARGEHLLFALRGRDAILEQTLPAPLYEEYVAARGRLMEAQVEKTGLDTAEQAYDRAVAHIRAGLPEVAALAWPEAPSLKEVQAALQPTEALVLLLVDEYVQAALFVDRTGAVLRPFTGDLLKPFADRLAGKKRILFAPHGAYFDLPLEAQRWQKGVVGDAFEVCYVPSAASFLRQRARPREKGQGTVALAAPGNPPPAERKALLVMDFPARIDAVFPQASRAAASALVTLGQRWPADVLLLPQATVARGPRSEGAGGLVEALLHAGAGAVVLSTPGPAPAEQVARFRAALEKGASPVGACREVQSWARAQGQPPALVFWGVP